MKRWSPEELEMMVRLGADIATRIRRGKLVAIPDEWVGHTTTQETIRKRQSKHPRKLRTRGKAWKYPRPRRERERSGEHLSWSRRRKTGSHPNNWAPRLSPHRLRYDTDEGWE